MYILILIVACLLTADIVSLLLASLCHHWFVTATLEKNEFLLKVVIYLDHFVARNANVPVCQKNQVANFEAMPRHSARGELVCID